MISYVQISFNLVCELSFFTLFFIFVTDCFWKLMENDQEAKKTLVFSPNFVNKFRH